MKITDKIVRDFYTEECAKSAWSVRQLERQINTMYYQRLLASKDKSSVAAEIQTSTPKPEYENTEELKRELRIDEFQKLDEN